MAPVDEPSADEFTTTSEDVGGSDRLFGNLKTQLRWEPGEGALRLNVRQLLETQRGVEIKYKGSLHTATGDFRYRAQLRKAFFTNTPSIARIMAADRGIELKGDGDKLDAGRILPAGAKGLLWRDWAIAPGIALSSDKDAGFTYTLGFRKQPQIVKRSGLWDSWLAAKGTLEFNPQTQQVGAFGNARLKLFRFGITSSQDAQVSMGWNWRVAADGAAPGDSLDGDGGPAGSGLSFSQAPYFKVAENDWAVRWQGSSVNFTYLI
ncbi:MAG: hypothetical protein J3K34DRAFT_433543 [Monoraphidium minutum]|nr:MAG: hypothetical protein J3K34DRAFT_433543 [Monoraphidium minutum]